jgi:hypothetical protein
MILHARFMVHARGHLDHRVHLSLHAAGRAPIWRGNQRRVLRWNSFSIFKGLLKEQIQQLNDRCCVQLRQECAAQQQRLDMAQAELAEERSAHRRDMRRKNKELAETQVILSNPLSSCSRSCWPPATVDWRLF